MNRVEARALLQQQRPGAAPTPEVLWCYWLVLHLVVLGSGAAVFFSAPLARPGWWLAAAAAVMAYPLLRLWRERHEVFFLPGWSGFLAFAAVGPANVVTLWRGMAIALLAGFILSPPTQGWLEWVPGLLYGAAALGDAADGYLARRFGCVTRFGARLDLELDALGLLVAPVCGVVSGRLPWWYLCLGAAYYVFWLAVAARRWLGRPSHTSRLRPSVHARMFAGLQMGFVAVALLPLLPPQVLYLAATLFMVPVLVGFGRDWLVVVGTLDPSSQAYRRGIQVLLRSVCGWLPLVLRASIGLMAVAELWRTGPSGLTVTVGFCAALIVVGVAGRVMSLCLVLVLSLTHGATFADHPTIASTLVCALGVLLLGTGPYPRS